MDLTADHRTDLDPDSHLSDTAPTALPDVTTVTFSWAVAGDAYTYQDTSIDVQAGTMTVAKNGAPPATVGLTASQLAEVSGFLAAAGVLSTLTASEPCGVPWADFNEYVQVDGKAARGRRKEITHCQQPAFAQLRLLWNRLRDQHFCDGRPRETPPFLCVRGLPGAACDDTGPRPTCQADRWVCPPPMNAPPLVPSNQCACTGRDCVVEPPVEPPSDGGRD